MNTCHRIVKRGAAVSVVAAMLYGAAPAKAPGKDPQQSRADYIARVQASALPGSQRTPGSLWVDSGPLSNASSDYKARNMDDTVIIQVVEQTSAQSNGDVSTERSMQANSAITGLPGKLKTGGVNPLFGAQSDTKLKGTGTSAATSRLTTSLTARVISVLPSGNLVVEAERSITMNNQHEMMIVRGVLRPGDIGPNNVALSTSLANLEVELKGKGVISDATRPINPIIRKLLWLIGF